MSTGSHHGDPSLSQLELDTCLEAVKWIRETNEYAPDWLPSVDDVILYFTTNGRSKSEHEVKTVQKMVRWIKIAHDVPYERF